MSIKIEHRNLETQKTLNDFFVHERNFLLPLSLKFFRHKEREAQSLYSGFFICHPRHTRVEPATKVSVSKQKSTVSFGVQFSTNSHFKNLSNSPACFRCVTSFALASLRFSSRAIVTSLTSNPNPNRSACAREHLC